MKGVGKHLTFFSLSSKDFSLSSLDDAKLIIIICNRIAYSRLKQKIPTNDDASSDVGILITIYDDLSLRGFGHGNS